MKLILIEAKSKEELLNILANKYGYKADLVQDILNLDPTKKYSYTQWFLKALKNQWHSNDPREDAKILFDFAFANHDFQLQNYDGVGDAFEAMEEFKAKSGYEVVFENTDWVVYHPLCYEGERYVVWTMLGGAKWCTAADSSYGRRYFNDYTDGGELYVMYNKTHEYNGGKALFQYSTKEGEFRDLENSYADSYYWAESGLEDSELYEWFRETTGEDLTDENLVGNYASEEFYNEADTIKDDDDNFLCYAYQHELYNDFNQPIENSGTYYQFNSYRHDGGWVAFHGYLIVYTDYYGNYADIFYRDVDDDNSQLQLVLPNAELVINDTINEFVVAVYGAETYIIDADCDFSSPPYKTEDRIRDFEVIDGNYESYFRIAYTENFGICLFHPFAYCCADGTDESSHILATNVFDVHLESGGAIFSQNDENGVTHTFRTDNSGEEMNEITEFNEGFIHKFNSMTKRLNEIKQRNKPILFN